MNVLGFLKSHCCTNCKFCSNPTQFNEVGSTGSYSTTLPLTQVTVPCVCERERVCVSVRERGGEGGVGVEVGVLGGGEKHASC